MAAQPKEQYVNVRGLHMHYAEWGRPDAPPAVLLHGLRSYGHVWDDVAAEMEPSFRVLALDQRGRGDTDWAPDADYSYGAQVQDVAEFARALGLDRFLLIGHSMGGRTALIYATQHSMTLTGLVIVDVGPDTMRARTERNRQEAIESPKEFASWEAVRAMLRRQTPNISDKALESRLRWTFAERDGKIVWRYDTRIHTPRRPAGAQSRPQGQPAPLWDKIGNIPCPTLIIRGGRSDVLPREMAERMVKVIPNAELEEIEGAGHAVYEDAPREFNDILLRWLKKHRLAEAGRAEAPRQPR